MVIVIAAAILLGLLAIAAAVVWTSRPQQAPVPDMREAVDLVLDLAADKLGDSLAAGTRELDVRNHAFSEQVAGVRAELERLDHLVGDLRTSSANQHGTLVENLRQVTATNTALASHTDALRQALASPKQRGQWGERMADDVLAAAGMVDGVNFRRQSAIEGGTIPDFRFLLPHDLELRMDVKFPIDNYLRVLDADADSDRAQFTKAFVRDVRGRIKELSARGYIDPRDTVDCMLLFIPNEAVYAFLHDADPDVLDVALGQKVVLCSPATLFAVLAVVRQSVEQFRLERVGDEILRCLGDVTDEWGKFTDSLDKLGKQLGTATRTFEDEVSGTRRRVFEKTLAEVDRLRDAQAPGLRSPGEALVAKKAAGDIRHLPTADAGDDGRGQAV
ncbi:DNA recombination protein RmuC [Actinospongicola halichondriae]|uniref:DNA recombination protein RmuC n=1 Tax=Actinospongicola halichondriae TaxID=3236844 RepID=UPI003D54769D